MLLVCRFTVAPDDADRFLARVHRALDLLGDADGFLGGEVGRAVDDPLHWVLTVRFRTVDAYRRALNPFPVREHVHPLLAEADTTSPAAHETLLSRTPTAPTETHGSLRTD